MSFDFVQFEGFKNLLNSQHAWPTEYTFKFIIKQTELEQFSSLFDGDGFLVKESGSGKYLSLTLVKVMTSGDEVLSVYKKASVIPGLIAL
jgi:putative lipoic acid-binding regulatory protein